MGTFTVVHKDYTADTFDAAAGQMLLDREVWSVLGGENGSSTGSGNGYAVDHWEWDQAEHRLRVWFR